MHKFHTTFELRSKILTLGFSQINLENHSLIRIFELRSKVGCIGNKNKLNFILYFSQFALPLQRNDRVYPTVTPAAMAEEHVCLCTDFLQQ